MGWWLCCLFLFVVLGRKEKKKKEKPFCDGEACFWIGGTRQFLVAYRTIFSMKLVVSVRSSSNERTKITKNSVTRQYMKEKKKKPQIRNRGVNTNRSALLLLNLVGYKEKISWPLTYLHKRSIVALSATLYIGMLMAPIKTVPTTIFIGAINTHKPLT